MLGEAWSRRIPSRWLDVTRNVALTCIPGQKACSKSSVSSATVASPSGAGSCVCASPPRGLLLTKPSDLSVRAEPPHLLWSDLTFRSLRASTQHDHRVRRRRMLSMNQTRAPMVPVTHTTIPSELGDLTVVARNSTVVGLYFPHHWYRPDPASFGLRSDAGFESVR